jgi:FkbM family methyltransferase
MYYGQPWRSPRRTGFYRPFIPPGALCFDIGAHAGNRIRTWLKLGARVVAVEPQPDFFRLLEWMYGRSSQVTLQRCALGDKPGTQTLFVSTRSPTVSSMSREWMNQVQADPRWTGVDWDTQLETRVETLDGLIATHGVPHFCKIDVEGFEPQVLRGLSQAIPGVSFEFIPAARDAAFDCVDRLSALAEYRFRYSTAESMRWAAVTPDWLDATRMKAVLAELPMTAGSGDVYAVRASGQSAPAPGDRPQRQ